MLSAKLIGEGEYIQVDNQMTFPNPKSEKMGEIEWKMRHAQASLSRGDIMYAASIICAYREMLLRKTQKHRNECIEAIRNV